MTEFLTVDGGTLAYEVTGASGPLVVLAHGMGDSREAYRFVVPLLVEAGYRVAAVDLRGCGESSVDWPDWSRTAIAGDLIAIIRHLGGPAVLVGHSISGGAATIVAAQAPELVSAVVELAPFTRKQSYALGDLGVARFRKGLISLLGATVFGSVAQWRRYLEVATPGVRPADWASRLGEIEAMLREPGRLKALQKMGQAAPVDAGAALPRVQSPVLIIEGDQDPDWASPQAEGEAIVAALPSGRGRLEMIAGAGHYPHAQFPEQVVALMLSFLETARA
ncbi:MULTISPECIES: alpha/beta hydrolase [Actinoplanes]|uniref:alpha/beta fold hydrolase n=1 Tax=Actinoplanes TaxID=1865 RepID=UPI0005F2A690|nr:MULTISPECIES: alpha/beta hydrolase [Actinoplanes]GLY02095.1 hydrolase [Actinoplanes sp. NBRC 101535]